MESIYAKIFAAKMKVFSFRKEEKKPAETLHDFLVVGFSIIFTFQKRITLFASSIFPQPLWQDELFDQARFRLKKLKK